MTKKLSIIIASQRGRRTIVPCLQEIAKQIDPDRVEVLVVDNRSDDSARLVSEHFPEVAIIDSPELRFIPELWERGIRESRGELVALTTAHFLPASNWVAAILKAHESEVAGVGGAIESLSTAGLIDWAVYFCRYSRYMLPFIQKEVDDFAGDNASYKRQALNQCEEERKDGFWEPFVHARIKQFGGKLVLTPEVLVYHVTSFGFAAFVKNRFQHGRQFGLSRAEALTPLRRTFYILFSFLIPVLLLRRVAGDVFSRKRNRRIFILSSPVSFVFFASWAVGELSGYLFSDR